jgi:hypothetical protein
MRKIFLYACVLGALMLTACGKRMPKDVIPTDEMESILYDYHLTTAMQTAMLQVDNVKREAMRRYIFSKHGVTEEQFDSSMVWYTRHPEELTRIYTRIQERFQTESKHVSNLLSSRAEGMTLSLPGDTVDMWHGDDYYLLKANEPLHQMITFSMAADSNFQANDAIRWTARYVFRNETRAVVRMGLSIIYENDSVVGEVRNVTRSCTKSIYLPQDSAFRIRAINGFIYVPANGSKNSDILVHNMELMRYHVPIDSTKLHRAVPDTATVAGAPNDSANQIQLALPDSVSSPGRSQRLSPDELKQAAPNHPHRPKGLVNANGNRRR